MVSVIDVGVIVSLVLMIPDMCVTWSVGFCVKLKYNVDNKNVYFPLLSSFRDDASVIKLKVLVTCLGKCFYFVCF